MTLASICGQTCGLPLFLHVLSATVLIGGISAVVVVAVAALRYPEHAALLRRIAFRTTLIVVWPAFIATVAGGHWTLSREHLADNRTPPDWALVGIAVTDVGVIVVIVLTVFAWLALRRPHGPSCGGARRDLSRSALGHALGNDHEAGVLELPPCCDARRGPATSVRAGAGDRLRNSGATYAERGPALSILVIILIVIVVLAVLGFFGRGRF